VRIVITIVITFFVTALVAAGVGLWFAARGGLGASKPEVVRVEKPTRGELTEAVSARAEVEPKTKVEISARVSARIVELPYEEGDRVTKGDPKAEPPVEPSVLVQLDATELRAALRSAEALRAAQAAQIEGTKASLRQAQRDLARQEKLLASADVSQADVDLVESRVAELQAALDSSVHSLSAAEMNLLVLQHHLEAADAEIERARDNLSYTTITSPIDGVVTRVHAEEGEQAIPGTMNNPGTVIIEVADLSNMLLVAQVDETDVGRVKVGQPAKAEIHVCPDEVFEGVVDSIALAHDWAQTGTKYFKTEILLDANGRQVLCGSTADVDIETRHHDDMLRMPSQAVLERPVDDLPLAAREDNPNVDTEKTYATVVYRFIDGQAVVTPVTVGPSDETHTAVVSGITEEDDVIVGPYKVLENIKHEQKVRDEKEVEAEKKAKEAAKEKADEDSTPPASAE
jgi:HlyD family secretion protein